MHPIQRVGPELNSLKLKYWLDINGIIINNLRNADGTVLLAESEQESQSVAWLQLLILRTYPDFVISLHPKIINQCFSSPNKKKVAPPLPPKKGKK